MMPEIVHKYYSSGMSSCNSYQEELAELSREWPALDLVCKGKTLTADIPVTLNV